MDSSVLFPSCLGRKHFSGTCYFKSAFPTAFTPLLLGETSQGTCSSFLLRHPLLHPAILSGSCDPLPIKVMHKCEHLRQGWIFLHFVLFPEVNSNTTYPKR